MKSILFFLCLCALPLPLFSQERAFDNLEMLYDQEHYKLVLKKAKKLIDKPEYDYSRLPLYYKSLALYRLSMNPVYFKKHPDALKEAGEGMLQVLEGVEGERYRGAKVFELQALKRDLYAWGDMLGQEGRMDVQLEVQRQLGAIFSQVNNLNDDVVETAVKVEVLQGKRGELVTYARTFEGVPYKWGGVTPKGFDCSGFTTFVFNEFEISLPRRASEQFSEGNKLDKSKIQAGDLVFFTHGKGISHVGVVVQTGPEGTIMVHASSSKGIVLTNIEKSTYWSNRVVGYCSYL